VKSAKGILKLMKEFPDLVIDRVEKNTHFKFYLSTPAGKKILVTSVTTSDDKSMKNNRSILRRWSRGEE
jgi:hypothetical protein